MILIVDDDKAVRQSLSLVLGHAGWTTCEASEEDVALVMVRQPSVEACILDMNLTPSSTGRQGINMLRKFKILRPEMPVILISAWGTIPLAVEGLSLGAADFVTKPWDNHVLVEKLRTAIEKSVLEKARSEHVDTLDTVERDAVVKAMRQADGNLTIAARLLGITRQALYRRIEKYGL